MKIQLSTGLILTLLTVVYQSKSCINDPGCTSCDVYLLGFVPIAFKCSKCDINYYLNSTNWVCYCTAGYYYEDASTECVKCNNPLCKQCTSSSVCTSCVESNNRILVNGECSCLQGYESVNNNQVCTKKQNILLIILSSVGSLVFCFLTIFVFYKICLARAI